MGLFKSSKPAQVPIPKVELHLASSESQVFKPNDIVSGHIAITTPIPVTPQAVEVSLWGLSKVWIRTSTSNTNSVTNTRSTDYQHYRDDAPLFTVSSNLLPQPRELVPGQSHQFPFQFIIPMGTGFDRRACYKDPQDSRWTTQPHNLPPTFSFGHPDYPGNCSVSYGVTARLITLTNWNQPVDEDPMSCTAPIIFSPANPTAHLANKSLVPFTKHFSLSSSSLTGQDPASIGFRQRMHDRFSPGTPKLDFELGIHIPDVLLTGSEMRFRTTFAVSSRSNDVSHVPAVTFRIKSVRLVDFTFFRAPRDWSASNTMSGSTRSRKNADRYKNNNTGWALNAEHAIGRENKLHLNSLPEVQTVELPGVEVEGEKKEEEEVERGAYVEAWFSGRVPMQVPPTFTSFAVTRCYRTKIKMVVEVGGKKFEHSAEGMSMLGPPQ